MIRPDPWVPVVVVSAVLLGLGRAPDETVAMTMPGGFARGAIPGTLLLIFAPLIIIPGLLVTAYSRRNAE